jgi:hypothetical protein
LAQGVLACMAKTASHVTIDNEAIYC